jgi:glycosyltransferase involved in cell wall biosynthesis
MRVTHVITRLIVGGAQENTIASVLGLAGRAKVEADLISGPSIGPEGSLEPWFLEQGGSLTVVPSLIRPVHPLADWAALFKLKRLFLQNKPDIVHTHSGKAGILGRLAAARAHVPVVVHTVHGPSFGKFQGRFFNVLFRSAERYVARHTTHFVVVAEAMKQQYLAAGIGEPGMYSTIFSGFDLNPFLNARNEPAVRSRYGIRPDDIVVGKIARLFRLKGHEELLAAAPEIIRKCGRIRFLLVGGGEWRERFEREARELGLADRFVFTGLVPPEDVPQLMGIMDIVVHLSRREGLARALPQALAAGRPLVALDCDGAKEVCIDGITGFLVGCRPVDFVNRVLELASNPELRERFGKAGRELVQQRFSLEAMVDSLYHLYRRLLGKDAEAPIRAHV